MKRVWLIAGVAALSAGLVAGSVSASAAPEASSSTLTPAKCKKKKGKARKNCKKRLNQQQPSSPAIIGAPPGFFPPEQVIGALPCDLSVPAGGAKCATYVSVTCTDCYRENGALRHVGGTPIHIAGDINVDRPSGHQEGLPVELYYIDEGNDAVTATVYTNEFGQFTFQFNPSPGFFDHGTSVEPTFHGNSFLLPSNGDPLGIGIDGTG